MVQAGGAIQAAAGGLQHGSEQDEREVGYSPRVEEVPSGTPTGKKSHKERHTTAETRLDVLEVSLEELYQSQRRLLAVESSLKEAESRIEKIEFLIDQLTKDTKDSVRHLHEVVTELTAKVMVLTRTLNAGENNTRLRHHKTSGHRSRIATRVLGMPKSLKISYSTWNNIFVLQGSILKRPKLL
ncbi:hypothetical protein BHE74_00002681 [Ensete ventricosum]|nr:hypothetical protein BHE74_00002681 [Ensete ventricosum]